MRLFVLALTALVGGGCSADRPVGACVSTAGGLRIDIPVATVAGALTVAGNPPDDRVTLTLENDTRTDIAEIAWRGSLGGTVVRGTYDLYYHSGIDFGGPQPANKNALISQGIAVDTPQFMLNVDVPSVTVRGTVKVNGAATDSLVLKFRLGDDEAQVNVSGGTYQSAIVPGTYDVYYAGSNDTRLPVNNNALVRTDVRIDGDTTLDLDLPSFNLSGAFSRDGQYPDYTDLWMQSLAGDSAFIPAGSTYSVPILPGIYDLYYHGPLTDMPWDGGGHVHARVATVAVTGPTRLDIAVSTVAVSGRLTFGGMSIVGPADVIFARRGGGETVVSTDATGAYAIKFLVAGTYDLFYRGHSPANQRALISSGTALVSARTLDIDMAAAIVSGTVTPRPGQQPQATQIHFKNGADEAVVAADGNGYVARLVAGTYHVSWNDDDYQGEADPSFVAIGPGTLDIHGEDAVAIKGEITLNAAPIEGGFGIVLRGDANQLSARAFGANGHSLVDDALRPGRYDLYSQGGTVGMPLNRNALVTCVDHAAK